MPLPSHLPVAALLISTPALSQTYSYDDGSTENALNIVGLAEIGFLHGFDAVGGADSIGELRVAIGTALAPAGQLDGNALRLAIWDDPTNDGDPSDAVLVHESSVLMATQTNSDIKVSYAVSPAVAVTGTFFVGVATDSIAGQFPVGLDVSSGGGGVPAYIFGDAGAIDLANLGAASVGLAMQTNAVFLLDAVGGGSIGLGTTYCSPAAVNSSGLPAQIEAFGSTLAAGNDLTLITSSMPPNSFGYYLASRSQAFIPGPGGSQGNLCLGGAIGRFLLQVQNAGPGGTISIPVDLTQVPQPLGSVAVTSGETWNFQCWFRDANPTVTSNFSNAVSLTFL